MQKSINGLHCSNLEFFPLIVTCFTFRCLRLQSHRVLVLQCHIVLTPLLFHSIAVCPTKRFLAFHSPLVLRYSLLLSSASAFKVRPTRTFHGELKCHLTLTSTETVINSNRSRKSSTSSSSSQFPSVTSRLDPRGQSRELPLAPSPGIQFI